MQEWTNFGLKSLVAKEDANVAAWNQWHFRLSFRLVQSTFTILHLLDWPKVNLTMSYFYRRCNSGWLLISRWAETLQWVKKICIWNENRSWGCDNLFDRRFRLTLINASNGRPMNSWFNKITIFLLDDLSSSEDGSYPGFHLVCQHHYKNKIFIY